MRTPWNRKKRTKELTIGLLLGLGCAAGCALGLLLASQAGGKTRSRLQLLARRGIRGAARVGIREAGRVRDTAAKTVARMPFVAAG